jgi:hypothetical protein
MGTMQCNWSPPRSYATPILAGTDALWPCRQAPDNRHATQQLSNIPLAYAGLPKAHRENFRLRCVRYCCPWWKSWKSVTDLIQACDERIEKLATGDSQTKLLRRLKGVGPVT